MRTIQEPARTTPVTEECDVAVIGGGPAGLIASIAAARAGARVVLVERYGYLGGLATGGIVLHMMAIFDKSGRRWIGGLPWELLERLSSRGGLSYETPTRPFADPEILKVVCEQMCIDAGVKLLYHTWAVGADVADGTLRAVITESKSGRRAIAARVFVDATGDADVASATGAETNSSTGPIGLPVIVHGVDLGAVRAFVDGRPDEAKALGQQVKALGGFALNPRPIPASDAGLSWINVGGLTDRTDGEHLDPLEVADLTYVEVELRRRLLVSLDFYREHAPGFSMVRLIAFASQLGVRESRRIEGLYRLSREDTERQRDFPDAVGSVAAFLGMSSRKPRTTSVDAAEVDHITIPYRCLLPRQPQNLVVAGRCASVDSTVSNTLRLIPPCMVTGQAAGTAAALALSTGGPLREVDTGVLRLRLERDGVIIG